jgi:ERCC4-related helicase
LFLSSYKITGIPERHTAEISGRSKPESRVAMWNNKRVFFCTPQTLVKDIEEGRCDASSIVCVVMDEAHRATGEHANSVLVRLIESSGAKFRLVGLSATPGTDIKSIQAVCDRLKVSRIEARAEDDPDVRRYIHHREEEVIVVRQPDVIKSLDSKFSELILPILTRLREERVSPRLHYDSATLQPWSVIQANKEYVERTGDYRLNGQFNVLRELVNARTLLKAHGVQMARTKLAEAAGKAFMNHTSRMPEFESLLRDMATIAGGGGGASGQDGPSGGTSTGGGGGFENNPKLFKLVEVLREHFERKEATGQSTRVIVFSQWRESVGEIVSMLTSQNSSLIKPAQVSQLLFSPSTCEKSSSDRTKSHPYRSWPVRMIYASVHRSGEQKNSWHWQERVIKLRHRHRYSGHEPSAAAEGITAVQRWHLQHPCVYVCWRRRARCEYSVFFFIIRSIHLFSLNVNLCFSTDRGCGSNCEL